MRKLTELEQGYLAGIIDGEGAIMIKNPRGNYFQAMCQIGQARPQLLHYLIEIAGGEGTITCHRTQLYWELRWYPKTLRWLLPQVVELLVLKRRQAELAMELISLTTENKDRVAGKYVPEEVVKKRLDIYKELRHCNVKPTARERGIYIN